MRLDAVEVSGFCNFPGTFKLDLRALPDGLIAVVGPNGAGKTSLALDAALAGLYGPAGRGAAFPSRDGKLADYATSPRAYIDTRWHLDGVGAVRSRVNVDGVKRKTNAVVEVASIDGVMDIINRDGLSESYREAIDAMFPSLRSLLASAYAAQNRRGAFGELDNKEKFKLFVELADLARYEERALTASRCAKVAESVAGTLRTTLDVLGREATPARRADLVASLAAVRTTLARATEAAEAARQRVATLEAERDTLTGEARAHAVAVARVEALLEAEVRAAAALQAHDAAVSRLTPDRDAAARATTARYDAAIGAIGRRWTATVTAYDAAVKNWTERIANNRTKVLASAEAITAAAARLPIARTDVVARRTVVDARAAAIASTKELRAAAQAALTSAQGVAGELQKAQTRAGLLATVKFGDDCGVAPACPLVVDAVAAREAIATLETTVAEIPALRALLDSYASQLLTLERELQDDRRTVAALDAEIVALEPTAALQPHLATAEGKIAEYERDLAAAAAAHAQAEVAVAAERDDAHATRDREIAALDATTDAARSSAAATRLTLVAASTAATQARVDAETAAHASEDAATKLAAVEMNLFGTRADLSAAEQAMTRAVADETALTTDLGALDRRLAEAEDLRRRLRIAEDEGLAWAQLARACGRDGLQRLEIDAAGPIVSDLANQLLAVGYGTRFSVEVVTQVATADGKDTKEKFTILARDNEHGGLPREIGDLSGGESVVVNEAIRAALACYVNLRNRQPVQTLWRDETTGALDDANAPQYIAMLRKMQQVSGARQVLFITHNARCAALADAQVRVVDGSATALLPPFR